MRQRAARVAIVDDDLERAVALDAALAADERVVVERFAWTLAAADLLGRLLATRADLVVLDLDGERHAPALVRSLRACGVELVVRTAHPHARLPPGCLVVGRDASLGEVAAVVRSRFAVLRGRPAPPRLRP